MKALAPYLAIALVAGCAEPASAPAPSAPSAAPSAAAARHAIRVDASGYHPASIEVTASQPVTLVFTRTSDEGCGQQLVFPSLELRRDLPLDVPVEVQITPERGEVAFTCGMNMLRGAIVAR